MNRLTAPSVRTSQSHPLRIATLSLGGGKIGLTLCPGKQQSGGLSGKWSRDLDLDLAAIRDWGARHVVTLLEPREMAALRVMALPGKVAAMGMRWQHLPIPDGGTPGEGFEESWAGAFPHWRQSLAAGHGVLFHCMGGLGRAGTVSARLLMSLQAGLAPAEAIARVRQVRPGAIETVGQEAYLFSLDQAREDT
jgi:ADP-ribosyl-[dinitrogen reductase] hydrolase